jgi:hypothetical protein
MGGQIREEPRGEVGEDARGALPMASKKETNHARGRNGKPSRYAMPEGAEAEFEPGSHGRVLKNRLGIRRKREMDRMEYEALATVQKEYLSRIGPDTRLTAALLCRMHRDWLDGRLARWVSDLMALQAGLPAPDYGFAGRGAGRRREAYLEAVKKGYVQDYEPLTAFFVEALERRLRERSVG